MRNMDTPANSPLINKQGNAFMYLNNGVPPKIREPLEVEARYAVYIARQQADAESVRRDEGRHIPEDFDYRDLPGLSKELQQKLIAVKPANIGQAARIDGMTPAALTLMLAHLSRRHKDARDEKAS